MKCVIIISYLATHVLGMYLPTGPFDFGEEGILWLSVSFVK